MAKKSLLNHLILYYFNIFFATPLKFFSCILSSLCCSSDRLQPEGSRPAGSPFLLCNSSTTKITNPKELTTKNTNVFVS